MRKLFLFLTVIGLLSAPAVVTEAAVITPETTVMTEETTNQNRVEERLQREAKRITREIFKAQRAAKKTERTETNAKSAELRKQIEGADRVTKKELREAITLLRENKKYDSVEEFLDNLVLYYDNGTVSSQGYVVSVADIRKNLDATVTYDSKTRTLTLTKEDVTVKVVISAEDAERSE